MLRPPVLAPVPTRVLLLLGLLLLGAPSACGGRSTPGDPAPDQPGNVCYADFPCQGPTRCVGDTQVQRVRTASCEESCGNVPCSGASCEADGPVQDCPPGTACRDDDIKGNAGSCQRLDDGGPGVDADVPPQPLCAVDFPCAGPTQCVGDHQIQRVRTASCEEDCGDVPCSGASCKPDGPIENCPAGTVCVNDPSGFGNPGHCQELISDGGVDLHSGDAL